MSLNGKKVTDFSLQAYQKGAFKEITSHALEGKWSVFFFYPADFTFFALRNWVTYKISMKIFAR